MAKKRREEPPPKNHSQFCGANVEKLALAVGIAGVITSSSMFALWLFTDHMGAIFSVVMLFSHSSLLLGLKTRKLFFYSIYLTIQALLICACLVVIAIYGYTLATGRPPGIVGDRYKSWQVEETVTNSSLDANNASLTAHAAPASDPKEVHFCFPKPQF
ncbi:hypothetical protein AAVH_12771 [Aphelenchoides avenae]|nr:hypothetical protein AAVH_12771 [Aphelenchus avenae]